MNCQNNAVLVSEFVRKLPTAARARKRADHLANAHQRSRAYFAVKKCITHVSFLGHLYHK